MSPMPADLPPVAPTVSFALHAPVSTGSDAWRPYRVKEGDTLYDLAAEHDTSVAALVKHNQLGHGGHWIMSGSVIELPTGKAKTERSSSSTSGSAQRSSAQSRASSSSTSSPRQVTVRPGDTLSHLSLRYDVSVASIVKANGLSNPRMIHAGQTLTIPGKAAQSSSSPSSPDKARSEQSSAPRDRASASRSATTVRVRAGDTLSHIAIRYRISLTELLRANSSLDPQRLWVGQQVKVPRVSAGEVRAWTAENIGDAKKGEDVPDTFLHYTYSSEVSRSAAANREYLAGAPVPSRSEVREMVVETAERHGVDPKLMLAVSSMESGWNQRAVSPANAIGVMQVIPSSGEWASSMAGRELNLLDPQDNITAGTVIMRSLLRAADTEDQAIGGYYQGLAGVQRHGMYSDTRHYVKTIQALRTTM